jgi:threonine/homoserine/homoserine lactone efflux protein
VDAFLAFLLVATGAMVVPGPDSLVVVRISLAHGASSGVWAAAGSGTGNVLWGAASVLGATRLLSASPTGFTALKLAGAAYLMVLGVQALVAARRGVAVQVDPSGPGRIGPGAAFRQGLLSDVLNVKVGLFWTALVPQFLHADAPALLPVAMVASMGCLAFAWLSAYAAMAARVRGSLGGAGVGQRVNATIGVGFLLLGAYLAVSA